MNRFNRISFILIGFMTFANYSNAHENTYHQYLIDLSQDQPLVVQSHENEFSILQLELIDADTNKPLPGLIRISVDGKVVNQVSPLLNRGTGLNSSHKTNEWQVVLEPTQIQVPKKKLTVKAISGLETELAVIEIDMSQSNTAKLTIPLERFYNSSTKQMVSGNTHLHLRRLSREQSDRYLNSVPVADGIDITFVSFLSRHGDDKTYISNQYTQELLENLSNPHQQFGWGEEMRHNFGSYEEGYGHVMLLNIPTLIHPVSIGPGIMDENQTDSASLRDGIKQAKEWGGTAIWCHNAFGFEDIPNWLNGMLDAQNIFDGGSTDSYDETFYRYLNVGLKVPFSTGTDWFMYDMARVYVKSHLPHSTNNWLQQLSQGKSFITNSTMLEFTVDGAEVGDTVKLPLPKALTVKGKGIGRHNFKSLELVYNGEVVHAVSSNVSQNHYEAELDLVLKINEPGWLALRINSIEQNEFGQDIFAHTSPIYIEIDGNRIKKQDAINELVAEMKNSIEIISSKGTFPSKEDKEKLLNIYQNAIDQLH